MYTTVALFALVVISTLSEARINPCGMPIDGGLCRAYFPSWGYDKKSGKCIEFVYGGCGGNANRFGTREACEMRIFDAIEIGLQGKSFPGVSVSVCQHTKHVTLEYEEPLDSLEAIHKYLHYPEFEMDPQILPSVCKMAKMYEFHSVWRKYGGLLARKISLENIGEVCPLVTLSISRPGGAAIFEDETSRELAIAVKKFMIDNANAIVSSQTGQLSARLFIDVLEGSQYASRETVDGDVNTPTESDDWDLSERVLLYCSHRVQEQEPLDEGNRKNFEDKSSRKLNNKTHASALDTVTDEIRMTIPDSQLAKFDRTSSSHQTSPPSEKTDHARSGEISRQTSCTSEATGTRPPSPLFDSDVETCLLAKTSFGAGSISIHLGKLQGRLVSLSVKRRSAPSGPGSSGSSSVAGAHGNAGLVLSALPASILLPPSPPPELNNPNMMSVVIPSDRNSTANEHCLEDFSPPTTNLRRGSIFRSLGCLPTPLIEARCSAGAVTICSSIDEVEEEALRQVHHWILIAGGTSEDRCLGSTEILRISRPIGCGDKPRDGNEGRRDSLISNNSDIESASNCGFPESTTMCTRLGPPMKSPRSRFALAALDGASSIYACGGSNGNDDLATVERLSFDSEDESYKKWRYVASMQQQRSCCAVATWADESRIMVMGGQCEGSPLSSVEAYHPELNKWISLPSMSEARSQLCAATLSQRGLIVAVGGISETPNTPSTQPSSSSAYANAHLLESADLSPSGEAYDPRCSHWTRLPELLTRGPLIGASLVPLSSSSGRLLLIGGTDGVSTVTQTQIFDSRAWSWLPGPSLSIGRASPCAVSLTPSVTQLGGVGSLSTTPYIAVIGGYNLSSGGFLNSVEIVGVTSSSGQVSPFSVPSNISIRGCVSPDPLFNVPDIPSSHSSSNPRYEEQTECPSQPLGIFSTN
nr:influenza virus NS1A binding protein [Hymenolepis microstoma]